MVAVLAMSNIYCRYNTAGENRNTASLSYRLSLFIFPIISLHTRCLCRVTRSDPVRPGHDPRGAALLSVNFVYLPPRTHNDDKLRLNPSYYHRFTTSLLHRHHQTLPGISTKVYCFHLSEVLRAYVPIPTTVSCSDLFIFEKSIEICRHRMPPSSLPSIVTIGALLTIEGERRYNGPDSEGGTGFVSRVHDDGTCDINLSVGGAEKNVHPRRIQNSMVLLSPPQHVVGVLPMILQRDHL
jgi:hypothetical protein